MENSANAEAVAALVQAGAVHGGVNVHTGSPPAPIPHNLPPAVRRFAGRAAELDRLSALAAAGSGSRVCVLDGPPGIGKTSLAVRWGRVARELFPHGQVYVDLRGFDPARAAVGPEAAARLILGALHVPLTAIPPDPDDQLALLRSMLDERRLLLVIDNVRDSRQVLPLIPGSGSCFTVVTARHRLDGLAVHHDAERIPLGPLSAQDSVQLLAQRLGTHRVEAEHEAVARVVAACGGHPMALSVVAARAADDATNSLNTIVRSLENRGDALDTLRLPDAADLRAVFALSYDNLAPAIAEGFRTLALHPGPRFDAWAAAAMIGCDLFQARETIHELSRCHLLERTSSGHHAFHALTHAYGLETARRDPPERRGSVLVSLLNHQLHAAHRADRLINDHRRQVPLRPCLRPELLPVLANRADALVWFDAEYDNVLSAIALAKEEGLHDYTWQLAWTTSNFAYLTARWQDWVDTHSDGLAAVRRLGDREVEVRLRQQLARAHREGGDYRRSIEEYLGALDSLEELGDLPGQANALNGLAAVQLRAGSPRAAFDAASRALELYEGLDDDDGTASTYLFLGQTCLALSEPEEARRHYRLAEDLYAGSGNLYGLAHVADATAELETAAGRPDLARAHLRQAVKLHHRFGNLSYAAKACRRLRALLADEDPAHPLVELLSAAIVELEHNRATSAAPLVEAITGPG
ncbi:tetratricopeptide repeat protein [Saccharothrix algeriensis]|uniref:Tetratricopeptide (TPR) repeat protein n=1 Tax=Saccharothrix algeriensis TaxID=173560 RepID=A0ABS2SF78_9PSEU|nr:tetratricopeptide repeat protein [Saccharothrix algeriensis]MBM7814927.1 tetratricopeptide (TPR) repeat protein [Saccharothrix algeriensis]